MCSNARKRYHPHPRQTHPLRSIHHVFKCKKTLSSPPHPKPISCVASTMCSSARKRYHPDPTPNPSVASPCSQNTTAVYPPCTTYWVNKSVHNKAGKPTSMASNLLRSTLSWSHLEKNRTFSLWHFIGSGHVLWIFDRLQQLRNHLESGASAWPTGGKHIDLQPPQPYEALGICVDKLSRTVQETPGCKTIKGNQILRELFAIFLWSFYVSFFFALSLIEGLASKHSPRVAVQASGPTMQAWRLDSFQCSDHQ